MKTYFLVFSIVWTLTVFIASLFVLNNNNSAVKLPESTKAEGNFLSEEDFRILLGEINQKNLGFFPDDKNYEHILLNENPGKNKSVLRDISLLELRINGKNTRDNPIILPQVAYSEILQGVYDFENLRLKSNYGELGLVVRPQKEIKRQTYQDFVKPNKMFNPGHIIGENKGANSYNFEDRKLTLQKHRGAFKQQQ